MSKKLSSTRATTRTRTTAVNGAPGLRADFERRSLPPNVDPSDAFGVYALSIFADEPDLNALLADALTGGADDKKADFIYIDAESERAFIGQSYLAKEWGKQEAKANKAAQLATAVSWLISTPIKKVPDALQRHAAELRRAIKDGVVKKLILLYTHNCHESTNVRAELETAASSARSQCGDVTVFAHELGIETLGRLFGVLDKDILVVDSLSFDVSGGYYETSGPNWEALATCVDGAVFHDLYNKYSDSLFSANIRSYLGSLKRKKGNINAEIRKTVEGQPDHFWVFNNGVTILTNDFRLKDRSQQLLVTGVSIINGAQTTGVLGNSLRAHAAKTMVPCRFIKCGDPATIDRIIVFNNTQNAVKSFDLRSNDRTQKALAADFQQANITYVHRRSQSRRAPANSIHVESVAQGLASLHGKFQVAIRQRSEIFDDDATYDSIFPKHIAARHVYLVQCLLDAVDALKLELRAKQRTNSLTSLQSEYLELLEFSTAKQFVVRIVGYVCDQITGSQVADLHKWQATRAVFEPDRSVLTAAWKTVLVAILPKIARATRPDPQAAVRSTERSEAVGDALADYLESEGEELAMKFKKIRRLTEIV